MTALRSLTFGSLGSEVELFAIEPAELLETTADWIRGLHRRLTRFEPDSELSRFNAKAGLWVDVSPVLHDLLVASLEAFEKSDGLVNVAILPALLIAGYDAPFAKIVAREGGTRSGPHAPRHRKGVRTSEPFADLRPAPSPAPALPDIIKLAPGRARLSLGAALDLGGIAKGWIADRAVERLGPNSLVSCGGDLSARGGGETGEGWPVGFGDRTLLLHDMAAATSGTSKRRWGEGLHHLIDPRTGAPSTSDLSEVSVLADTAVDAEVYAKTAFLLGSEGAEAYLRSRSKGWALS